MSTYTAVALPQVNPRWSYNNQRMARELDNTLIHQATMIPQGVLETYSAPSVSIPDHPVKSYPTPPSDHDNSTSFPDALPPGAFLLTGPLSNAYRSSLNGLEHPLPEHSSATCSTAVAQSLTTSIPGPFFSPYETSFDGHPLQDHPVLINHGQPPADPTVVAQSESLGMGSLSATILQGMASLVSAEDNATPASVEVQTPKVEPSEDSGNKRVKEKPPHHRSAKATRSSELWERVQNTRRSKAPNHPSPYKSEKTTKSKRTTKPKRTTKRRAGRVNNVLRRAPHKISLEASQTLITEWQRLNLEKRDLPIYEVVSATYEMKRQGDKWRCSFSDNKGQCDTVKPHKAETERHSLTHYPVRWLCLNPSCGGAFSRIDAVKRHYKNTPRCKIHWRAKAKLETDATGPVVLLGAEGPKLVWIRWVEAD